MKKFLILFMSFFITFSLSAQKGNRSMDPAKRAKKEVETIKKQLNLDKKQEKECYKAHVDHYKRHLALFKKDYTRETLRKEILKERKIFHKKLQTIFTKEQHIMYMNIQKERKKKMKARMGKREERKGLG